MTSPYVPGVNTLDPVAHALTPVQRYPNTSDQDFSGAIDRLAQLATGNDHINTHPGLMDALLNSSASPQQVQQIDQFMAGVKAQNMYTLALQQGAKINFSPAERNALDAMQFDYSKVDVLNQTNQQATIDNLKTKGMQPVINPNGTLAIDTTGNLIVHPIPQAAPPPQPGQGGFFDKGVMHGVGRILHDVTHNPVTNVIGQGYNIAQAAATDVTSHVTNDMNSLTGALPGTSINQLTGKPNETASNQQLADQRKSEMTAMGYDPSSQWSVLAFDAHGYAKTDIQPAITAFDQSNGPKAFNKSASELLPEALKFNADPKAYQEAIIKDTSLTPDEVGAKLNMLRNPDFIAFSQRLNADTATIGNLGAQNLGVDPVKNPLEYHLLSAATDLVASFYIDPTMVTGKVVNFARKSPLAIKSMNDSEGMVRVLDPATAGPLSPKRAVINGFQSMLDSTNQIRDALQAGDTATAAAAYASIRAKTPALEPLVGEFLGPSQSTWRKTAQGVDGLTDQVMMTARGEPVTNLAEVVKYITAKGGLTRLTGGKAMVESTYMPGAVSNYGYRAIKANVAAHMAKTDAVRTAAQDADFLAARNAGTLSASDTAASKAAMDRADPAVPTETVDLSKLTRWLPDAIDGVDMKSGLVVAAPDASFIGQHVDVVKDAMAQVQAAQKAVSKSARTRGEPGLETIPDLESNPYNIQDVTRISRGYTGQPSQESLQALQQAGMNVAEAKSDLASAIRAANARAPKTGDWADTLLPAERGMAAYNVRRTGSATGEGSFGGWSAPQAVAARARMAATRWSMLSTRNTKFDLTNAADSDKVYKFVRFYLGKGSAADAATQFANGDIGTRKAIVEGIWQQVAHAAGLPKTKGGQELLKSVSTEDQAYTHAGSGWIIDGSPVAQHDGQVTKVITLPGFKDIHYAASKMGAYEGSVGRLATSQAVDHLFNIFRFGILAAPKTAYRNIIEPYAKAALDGQYGDALRVRALTYLSSDQLANLGKRTGISGLTGEVPEHVIQIARTHLNEMIKTGTSHQQAVAKFTLSRVEKGDLGAMAGYGRTRPGSMLADTVGHLAGWYRSALASYIPPEQLAHADELPNHIPQMAHEFSNQTVSATFDPYAAKQVRDIVESGLQPGKLTYNLAAGQHPLLKGAGEGGKSTLYTKTGYGLESTDKSVGQARYINALAQRTYDAPEVARAAMQVLRDPEGNLKPVMEALDSRIGPRLTAYGQYFKPDPTTGNAIRAITPDEINLGKKQWAQDVVNDFRYMLQSENGTLNTKITDFITENGHAPDGPWMDENVKGGEIPRVVLAPEYTAKNLGGPGQLAATLNDLTGRAFNQIVEAPIKRQSSMPFLAAHYLKARAEQDATGMLDKMVDAGLDRKTADQLLQGQAIRDAYVRVEQMIDDPGLKTQFDIVARNLFMFPRAMEAFVRRWGGSLVRDPFKARKMMLALEATEHSGMVYRDQHGDLTFTYPGSEVMRDVMVGLSKLPGFAGMATFPTGMDMTGKVMLAAPGFDQPFRFSLSPMVNIPMRFIFARMPEHQSIWAEVDQALNGQIGQGRGPLQSIEPSAIQKLLAATGSDANSIFASAVVGAIAHLSAAGYMPKPSDPPTVQDNFVNQVKTQVRNQLYWRFALGLVAPSPPSALQSNIPQSAAKPGFSGTHSDYAFNLAGIRNLGDEYKSILDSTGGDVARASQIFTYMHPEGLAYTVATTGAGVNKAILPATAASLQWMETHIDFLSQYKSVGAYFMPKPPGEFDNTAYQAQLAMGIRQKKTIDEFYQSVQESLGANAYFKQYDDYKQARAEAISSGDPQRVAVLASAFNGWKTQFMDQNLFLKGKFAESTTGKIKADAQLEDLQHMVDHNAVPNGLGPQVGQMVKLWTDYSQWRQQNVGNTHVGAAMRQAALDWVDQHIGSIAKSDPVLTNVYNGVFRALDPSLSKI